jgi:hypothetical protein
VKKQSTSSHPHKDSRGYFMTVALLSLGASFLLASFTFNSLITYFASPVTGLPFPTGRVLAERAIDPLDDRFWWLNRGVFVIFSFASCAVIVFAIRSKRSLFIRTPVILVSFFVSTLCGLQYHAIGFLKDRYMEVAGTTSILALSSSGVRIPIELLYPSPLQNKLFARLLFSNRNYLFLPWAEIHSISFWQTPYRAKRGETSVTSFFVTGGVADRLGMTEVSIRENVREDPAMAQIINERISRRPLSNQESES